MNLKYLRHRLPFLGGPSSVLVCETDGFHLRGAVISRSADKLKIDLSAKSEATEYRVAVNELVSELRGKGWRGHEVILLSPAVFSTLIELPIAPKQQRNPLQMQELIRWELEPLLMQHATVWSAGQILLALGYMTEAQVANVLERQQGKQQSGLGDGHGGMYSFRRFGELAMDMGFITQSQLDDCLAKQSWLHAESDDFSCGWVPQAPLNIEENYHVNAETGIYPWLVSGANAGMMRQWESAFATQKVTLLELYPLVGCTVELMESTTHNILLESLHGLVGGIRLEAGAVATIKTQQSKLISELDACLESYHGLVTPDVQQVWLATSSDTAKNLVAQFSEMIGREVRHLQELSPEVSAGMLGAATAVLMSDAPCHIASVSVRGPKPPVFQRVEVRAVTAAILLLLIIGVLELSLYVREDLAQAEHTRTAADKKAFDTVVAGAQAKVDEVTKLQAAIKTKEDELTQLVTRFDFFAIELPARTAFIQALLNELTNNVNDDVVINAIEETPNLGFRIAGWALSETAAQQFIQSFKLAMAPWETDLVDPIVRAQAGPLGLLGYNIHFRLVSTKAENPQITSVTSPAPAQPRRRQGAR